MFSRYAWMHRWQYAICTTPWRIYNVSARVNFRLQPAPRCSPRRNYPLHARSIACVAWQRVCVCVCARVSMHISRALRNDEAHHSRVRARARPLDTCELARVFVVIRASICLPRCRFFGWCSLCVCVYVCVLFAWHGTALGLFFCSLLCRCECAFAFVAIEVRLIMSFCKPGQYHWRLSSTGF